MKTRQEYFITPFKYKWFLLEQLPIEIMIKMLKLYSTEINIDTIKLTMRFTILKINGSTLYIPTDNVGTVSVCNNKDGSELVCLVKTISNKEDNDLY